MDDRREQGKCFMYNGPVFRSPREDEWGAMSKKFKPEGEHV